MSNTLYETQVEKLAQRFLTIKEGDICHINNIPFDITINEVIHNIPTFQNRNSGERGCSLMIDHTSVRIREEFGRDQVEEYNLVVGISYTNLEKNDPSPYWKYRHHLFNWLYLVMSDHTEVVNNFWSKMYSKPSDMRPEFRLTRFSLGKSFQAVVTIPNFRVKTKTYDIFV